MDTGSCCRRDVTRPESAAILHCKAFSMTVNCSILKTGFNYLYACVQLLAYRKYCKLELFVCCIETLWLCNTIYFKKDLHRILYYVAQISLYSNYQVNLMHLLTLWSDVSRRCQLVNPGQEVHDLVVARPAIIEGWTASERILDVISREGARYEVQFTRHTHHLALWQVSRTVRICCDERASQLQSAVTSH